MSGDLQDAGGPSIPLRMGRKDAPGPESQQPEGNLPGIGPHNVICGLHGLLIGSTVTLGSLRCDVLSDQYAAVGAHMLSICLRRLVVCQYRTELKHFCPS